MTGVVPLNRIVLLLTVFLLLVIPCFVLADGAGVDARAAPTAGWTTLGLLGLGLVQKHMVRKLPNNAIPWVNLALGTAVGYMATGSVQAAVQFGGSTAAVATGAHQYVKGALRATPVRGI